MPINLSGLSNLTTGATALSNLLLVTPNANLGYQPQNTPGIDGSTSLEPQDKPILFHYEGEQSITIESDITDHYIEDNTSVQDQIALKPEMISTHGFIGELNDVTPPALAFLKEAANRLTTVTAYAPQVSETASLVYAEAFFLYQVTASAIRTAQQAWSSLPFGSGKPQQNNQQEIFTRFYGYWRNRRLFTVQTPWALFDNMAIKSLRAIQDSDTRVVTDFEVVFKKINTAKTSFRAAGITLDGRASSQAAPGQDLGTSSPTESSTSFANSLASTVA